MRDDTDTKATASTGGQAGLERGRGGVGGKRGGGEKIGGGSRLKKMK